MAKTFVRVEVPDNEDLTAIPEIVLIDLERISYCEISTDEDGSEWYAVYDAAGKAIVEFDVNMMDRVADAIEQAARKSARRDRDIWRSED